MLAMFCNKVCKLNENLVEIVHLIVVFLSLWIN